MIIAAIDPGLEGALAWGDSPASLDIADLPTMGESKQRMINGTGLRRLLEGAHPDFVIVEQAQTMPEWGVAQAGRFMLSYGQILGVVQGMNIPHATERSHVWKKALSIPGGPKGKERARQLAIQLFPHLEAQLAQKGHHNRADAIMLWHWWRSSGLHQSRRPRRRRLTQTDIPR